MKVRLVSRLTPRVGLASAIGVVALTVAAVGPFACGADATPACGGGGGATLDGYRTPSAYHGKLLERTKPALAFASRAGDVEAHQRKVRAKLSELLRCDPSARSREIEWKSLGSKRIRLGSVEKVVFGSRAFSNVPGLLCIPEGWKGDVVFICLQGHTQRGMYKSINAASGNWDKTKRAAGDRDFAIGCMERGIAAFCVEQSCFGERADYGKSGKPVGCAEAYVHALMLGETLIGERVYDVARAVDFLRARPETARAKIGITGNSGGGTVAVYSAALLPEIDFCMPSCSFGSYAGSKMRVHHCVCAYIPDILRFMEMDDVMACFAPRPLVVVAGKDDRILPLASVREAFGRLEKVYADLGAQDRCRLVVGGEGHRFYAKEAWEAMLPLLRQEAWYGDRRST